MSKNCEVFKTVEERVVAFQNWCKNAPQQDCANTECTECQFKWLELENKDSIKKKFRFKSMADARDAFHHFCDEHDTDGSTLECDCPFNGNKDCFGAWLEKEGFGV